MRTDFVGIAHTRYMQDTARVLADQCDKLATLRRREQAKVRYLASLGLLTADEIATMEDRA